MSEYSVHIRAFTPNARRYLLTSVFLGLGFGLQFLFFNLYVLSLGYDRAFVGTLAGVPALVTALSAIPIGLLLPRLGFRRSLLLGSLLSALALLGWTLFPGRSTLVLASATFGLGSSLIWICSSPLMVAVTAERERTYLFSVQFALNTLAGVAANLIGGQLPRLLAGLFRLEIGEASGYRAVLLVALGITLLAIIPIASLRGLPAGSSGTLQRRLLAPQRTVLTKLLVVQLTVSLGAGLLIPFVNVFYHFRYGISDAALGSLFAVSSLATGLAGLVAPWMADRLGKIRTIVLTQALSIPFLILMGFFPSFGASAAGYLIRTALMNMSAPIYAAYAMGLVPPGLRPLTASLMTLSWNGGWAAAAWVSGRAQMNVGFPVIFAVTGTLYVIVIVLTHVFFRDTADPSTVSVAETLHIDEKEEI